MRLSRSAMLLAIDLLRGRRPTPGSVRMTGLVMALFIAGALFCARPHALYAASITVDGTTCTLVNAITAANSDSATGGCTAGSGADTIILASNATHTLTTFNNTSSDGIRNGLPQITSNITIDGNNATINRPINTTTAGFRLFYVSSTGSLTLNNLTLQGGSIQGRGAGIANLGGTVIVNNVKLVSNASKLTTGSGGGGGIYSSGGTVTLTNSLIQGSMGGALNLAGGELTLNSSTVFSNIDTGEGTCGGIFIAGTLVTLNNSTVTGNVSSTTAASNNKGGGITVSTNGTLTLNNSTVTGNSSLYSGGGIRLVGATSSLTLLRSLIAGNTATSGSHELFNNSGTVTANNYNLFGHSGRTIAQALSGFTPGATDLTATSDGTIPAALSAILNSTAASNGASNTQPALTHALVFGSPAIDAGGATGLTTDQRGIARPQGAAHDIGAFEWESNRVSPQLTQLSFGKVSSVLTPDATYPAQSPQGVYVASLVLQNKAGSGALHNVYYRVTALTNNNWLLNADQVPGQVGSKLSVANSSLPGSNQWEAGQNLTQNFTIGLLSRNTFSLRVSVYANTANVTAAGVTDDTLIDSYEFVIDPTAANSSRIFLPIIDN